VSDARDNPLVEHARACEECRAGGAPLTSLAALLDADAVELDAERLSRLVLARAAPALAARAQATFWRRMGRTLAAALVPLPLVVGIDLWLLGWLYALVAAWLPTSVALYVVISYAATLLVLIGSTYAAIPLLLARPVPEPDAAPA
jgi:hypothetical protein